MLLALIASSTAKAATSQLLAKRHPDGCVLTTSKAYAELLDHRCTDVNWEQTPPVCNAYDTCKFLTDSIEGGCRHMREAYAKRPQGGWREPAFCQLYLPPVPVQTPVGNGSRSDAGSATEAGGASGSPLERNASYYVARTYLIRNGWRPVITHSRFGKDAYPRFRGKEVRLAFDAGEFTRHGYVEVEDCGRWPTMCDFNFRKGGKCLKINARGSYDPDSYPQIVTWSSECRTLEQIQAENGRARGGRRR